MAQEKVESLIDRPGYATMLDEAIAVNDVKQETDEAKNTRFTMLLHRIGRGQPSHIEPRLHRIIRIIDFLSIADGLENEFDIPKGEIAVRADATKSLTGGLYTSVRGRMPAKAQSQKAIYHSQTVMRAMASQFYQSSGYSNEFWERRLQTTIIYERSTEHPRIGVSLQTDVEQDLYRESDIVPHPAEPQFFEASPRNVRSHRQQLLYIAGAVAVTQAAQFTN